MSNEFRAIDRSDVERDDLAELVGRSDPHANVDLSKVIAAVKSAPNSGKFDVRGTMGLTQAVARFDTITFDDQATLILEAVNADFIAIATREILLDIRNPQYRAFLSRPIGKLEAEITKLISGAPGLHGHNGQNGGRIGREGQPGGPGSPGNMGQPGRTKQMPPMVLGVQSFKFGTGATPSRQYFYLHFKGLRGGNGGAGGDGGSGGAGGNGEPGSLSLIDCKHGAGNGGRAGNAGSGGLGGDAGVGGDGASLYLYAPDGTMFDYSTGNIEPGEPGEAGHGGRPGSPGAKGKGGASVGAYPLPPCCAPGHEGGRGLAASPPTFGDGRAGQFGARGVQVVKNRDNSDLF